MRYVNAIKCNCAMAVLLLKEREKTIYIYEKTLVRALHFSILSLTVFNYFFSLKNRRKILNVTLAYFSKKKINTL